VQAHLKAAAAPAGDPTSSLIEALMHLIRAAKTRDWIGGVGLSRIQVAILGMLKRGGARRVTALAEELGADLSVVSRHVNALTEAAMTERVRDPEDGRAWLVSLAPGGEEVLAQVWRHRRAVFEDILAGVPEADVARLAVIVETVATTWDQGARAAKDTPLIPVSPLAPLAPLAAPT
jgi:DNA-binding MarR family transcriptional regulator